MTDLNSDVSYLQAKLKISHSNDNYEQEADRVADAVLQMLEPRFGYDLSKVRVHTDFKSSYAAQALTGLAFTG